jgi:hypothetical protein
MMPDDKMSYFTSAAFVRQLLDVDKGDRGTKGIKKRKKWEKG